MPTFRAGKLARKKNGRFLSTVVKNKRRNFLDSTKSRALMMLKCHCSTKVKVRRVVVWVELGLISVFS